MGERKPYTHAIVAKKSSAAPHFQPFGNDVAHTQSSAFTYRGDHSRFSFDSASESL